MSLSLLELCDPGLRVSNSEGPILTSPGFALIPDKNRPVFGREALKQARLHPRQTFNQFWYQLNLEPLANKNDHFRHQADLAYGHLADVAKSASLDGNTLLIVPGHFNRQQLGILLGLINAGPFNAAGLADLGLLAATAGQTGAKALYLDMQLHQAVLTLTSHQDGELVRTQTLQVPGSGWLALQDAWAGLITEAFLHQGRFNPQHNAETEQFLYDQLPLWLETVTQRNEVGMEINFRGTLHQASTSLSTFIRQTERVLQRLRDEIQALSDEDTQLLVPASLAAMPGVSGFLPAFDTVTEDAVAEAAFRFQGNIEKPPETLSLVTRLPAPSLKPAARKTPVPAQPLSNNQAMLYVLEGHKARPLNPDTELARGLTLQSAAQGLQLAEVPPGLKVNEADANPGQLLRAGDHLTVEARSLLLIEVEEG